MKKKLFYYGCVREIGHHLWEDEGYYTSRPESYCKDLPGVNPSVLNYIDANFTPEGSFGPEGLYNESIVPPLRIVAWNDRSIDSRPGSNSALVGYGYDSGEEMLNDALIKFPSVMNRQKRPIKYTQQ